MNGLRKTLPIIGLILMALGLAIFGIFYSGTLTLKENMQGQLGKVMIAAFACGGLGALLVLLGFQFKGIGPNSRYYLSYSLTSIFVFGCLVMVYLIVHNHSKDFDVTEVGIHSLHPRTKEFLRNLDKDIHITAFPSPTNKREIETFFERYSRFSSSLRYEVRDPYKDVKIAKRYAENITPGDIFIWTGTRGEGDQLNSPDFREKKINAMTTRDLTESKMTNAIVEVMRPDKITVYCLQGHGETSLEPSGGGFMAAPTEGRPSYSGVQQVLHDEMSFDVKTLNLTRTGYIPDNCSLLICAGPQADLLPFEAQALAKYLEGGGRALFLLDPNERRGVRFTEWERLMAHFGVKIQHDMVLESNPLTQLTGNPTMLLVNHFGDHPTVSNQSEMIQMGASRTVAPLENRPSSLTVTELMFSSDRSWSEDIEKLRGKQNVEPDLGRMKEQPLAVAVSMESPGGPGPSPQSAKGMRMVVLGDSEVFENRFFSSTVRLFANIVNWLVAREDLIDIPPKRLPDTPIFVTQVQLRTVFTLLVLAVPGVIFFGGIGYVLVRRRVR